MPGGLNSKGEIGTFDVLTANPHGLNSRTLVLVDKV
jgi:hypothetical protein